MTTKRVRAAAVIFASALAFSCAGSVGRRGGLPAEEIEAFPPAVAKSYELFAQRCSRCHPLSRPLDADIREPSHWKSYVTRMRRNPGSGISKEDAKEILVFLEYWAAQRKDPDGKEGT